MCGVISGVRTKIKQKGCAIMRPFLFCELCIGIVCVGDLCMEVVLIISSPIGSATI